MATQTKKKEGLFKARKGGGFPEMTNKGLAVIGGLGVVLLAFVIWANFIA